jgi:chromosome segregation ATPase
MLRQIEAVNEDRRTLAEEGERKNGVIRQMESQISSLSQIIQAKEEQQTTEMDRLKLAHGNEVEQLRLKIQDLNTQHQLVLSMKDAELAELKSHTALNTTKIETDSKSLLQEREMNKKLRLENAALQSTVSELQAGFLEKDNTIEINAASIKRKDSELQAKSRALQEKDATISAMSEQMTKSRDYLATEKQVSSYNSVQI